MNKETTATPLVSVFIPVYNAGSYLKEAVVSIQNQTYQHLEIVIVDDGSTDGCMATISDIKDARIKIFCQENAGKASALNHARTYATGAFWMIQDADDLSHPERVATLVAFLQKNPNHAAVFSGHNLLLNDMVFAPTHPDKSPEVCREDINNFRIPAHDASGMFSAGKVRHLHFDPELRIGQGIDFILKVGECHPISVIDSCLLTYRINYDSTIRQNPSRNYTWINEVIKKACIRRGMDQPEAFYLKPRTEVRSARSKNTHIVSHCMNSVIDLKKKKQVREAVSVGARCAWIVPFDHFFYKPLVYAVTPLSLINLYRKRKL